MSKAGNIEGLSELETLDRIGAPFENVSSAGILLLLFLAISLCSQNAPIAGCSCIGCVGTFRQMARCCAKRRREVYACLFQVGWIREVVCFHLDFAQ